MNDCTRETYAPQTFKAAGGTLMNQVSDDESALGAIRRHCGDTVAERLIEAFAGLKIFIPLKPVVTSKLAVHFDGETLKRISEAAGGESFVVPIGSRSALGQMRARVRTMLLNGKPANQIVQAAGCSVRTVFAVKAAMREAGELPKGEAA